MLSLEDRRRIEAEEQYRAEVRARLGPVQTTSFINKLAKLIVVIVVGWFVLALAIGVWALLLSGPAKSQQRQLYDAAGRNAGRIVTDSAGNQTLHGADGRAVVRTSPDSSGSVYNATTGRRIDQNSAIETQKRKMPNTLKARGPADPAPHRAFGGTRRQP
jgi:hypothetical protein